MGLQKKKRTITRYPEELVMNRTLQTHPDVAVTRDLPTDPEQVGVNRKLPENHDWVYSATEGTISQPPWWSNWKKMRARWHPQYLFGHSDKPHWDQDYETVYQVPWHGQEVYMGLCQNHIVAMEPEPVTSYTLAHPVYDTGTSTTGSTDTEYTKYRRSTRRTCTCFLIVLGLLLVALAVIPVLLHIFFHEDNAQEVLGRVKTKLKLVKIEYQEEMANTSSPEFQKLARFFGQEIDYLYNGSEIRMYYDSCKLIRAERGSILVHYDLLFNIIKQEIPSHRQLKDILYSVERDKNDTTLGVLGDYRFRIDSIHYIDTDTVVRYKSATPDETLTTIKPTGSDSWFISGFSATPGPITRATVTAQPGIITEKNTELRDRLDRNNVFDSGGEILEEVTKTRNDTSARTTSSTPMAKYVESAIPSSDHTMVSVTNTTEYEYQLRNHSTIQRTTTTSDKMLHKSTHTISTTSMNFTTESASLPTYKSPTVVLPTSNITLERSTTYMSTIDTRPIVDATVKAKTSEAASTVATVTSGTTMKYKPPSTTTVTVLEGTWGSSAASSTLSVSPSESTQRTTAEVSTKTITKTPTTFVDLTKVTDLTFINTTDVYSFLYKEFGSDLKQFEATKPAALGTTTETSTMDTSGTTSQIYDGHSAITTERVPQFPEETKATDVETTAGPSISTVRLGTDGVGIPQTDTDTVTIIDNTFWTTTHDVRTHIINLTVGTGDTVRSGTERVFTTDDGTFPTSVSERSDKTAYASTPVVYFDTTLMPTTQTNITETINGLLETNTNVTVPSTGVTIDQMTEADIHSTIDNAIPNVTTEPMSHTTATDPAADEIDYTTPSNMFEPDLTSAVYTSATGTPVPDITSEIYLDVATENVKYISTDESHERMTTAMMNTGAIDQSGTEHVFTTDTVTFTTPGSKINDNSTEPPTLVVDPETTLMPPTQTTITETTQGLLQTNIYVTVPSTGVTVDGMTENTSDMHYTIEETVPNATTERISRTSYSAAYGIDNTTPSNIFQPDLTSAVYTSATAAPVPDITSEIYLDVATENVKDISTDVIHKRMTTAIVSTGAIDQSGKEHVFTTDTVTFTTPGSEINDNSTEPPTLVVDPETTLMPPTQTTIPETTQGLLQTNIYVTVPSTGVTVDGMTENTTDMHNTIEETVPNVTTERISRTSYSAAYGIDNTTPSNIFQPDLTSAVYTSATAAPVPDITSEIYLDVATENVKYISTDVIHKRMTTAIVGTEAIDQSGKEHVFTTDTVTFTTPGSEINDNSTEPPTLVVDPETTLMPPTQTTITETPQGMLQTIIDVTVPSIGVIVDGMTDSPTNVRSTTEIDIPHVATERMSYATTNDTVVYGQDYTTPSDIVKPEDGFLYTDDTYATSTPVPDITSDTLPDVATVTHASTDLMHEGSITILYNYNITNEHGATSTADVGNITAARGKTARHDFLYINSSTVQPDLNTGSSTYPGEYYDIIMNTTNIYSTSKYASNANHTETDNIGHDNTMFQSSTPSSIANVTQSLIQSTIYPFVNQTMSGKITTNSMNGYRTTNNGTLYDDYDTSVPPHIQATERIPSTSPETPMPISTTTPEESTTITTTTTTSIRDHTQPLHSTTSVPDTPMIITTLIPRTTTSAKQTAFSQSLSTISTAQTTEDLIRYSIADKSTVVLDLVVVDGGTTESLATESMSTHQYDITNRITTSPVSVLDENMTDNVASTVALNDVYITTERATTDSQQETTISVSTQANNINNATATQLPATYELTNTTSIFDESTTNLSSQDTVGPLNESTTAPIIDYISTDTYDPNTNTESTETYVTENINTAPVTDLWEQTTDNIVYDRIATTPQGDTTINDTMFQSTPPEIQLDLTTRKVSNISLHVATTDTPLGVSDSTTSGITGITETTSLPSSTRNRAITTTSYLDNDTTSFMPTDELLDVPSVSTTVSMTTSSYVPTDTTSEISYNMTQIELTTVPIIVTQTNILADTVDITEMTREASIATREPVTFETAHSATDIPDTTVTLPVGDMSMTPLNEIYTVINNNITHRDTSDTVSMEPARELSTAVASNALFDNDVTTQISIQPTNNIQADIIIDTTTTTMQLTTHPIQDVEDIFTTYNPNQPSTHVLSDTEYTTVTPQNMASTETSPDIVSPHISLSTSDNSELIINTKDTVTSSVTTSVLMEISTIPPPNIVTGISDTTTSQMAGGKPTTMDFSNSVLMTSDISAPHSSARLDLEALYNTTTVRTTDGSTPTQEHVRIVTANSSINPLFAIPDSTQKPHIIITLKATTGDVFTPGVGIEHTELPTTMHTTDVTTLQKQTTPSASTMRTTVSDTGGVWPFSNFVPGSNFNFWLNPIPVATAGIQTTSKHTTPSTTIQRVSTNPTTTLPPWHPDIEYIWGLGNNEISNLLHGDVLKQPDTEWATGGTNDSAAIPGGNVLDDRFKIIDGSRLKPKHSDVASNMTDTFGVPITANPFNAPAAHVTTVPWLTIDPGTKQNGSNIAFTRSESTWVSVPGNIFSPAFLPKTTQKYVTTSPTPVSSVVQSEVSSTVKPAAGLDMRFWDPTRSRVSVTTRMPTSESIDVNIPSSIVKAPITSPTRIRSDNFGESNILSWDSITTRESEPSRVSTTSNVNTNTPSMRTAVDDSLSNLSNDSTFMESTVLSWDPTRSRVSLPAAITTGPNTNTHHHFIDRTGADNNIDSNALSTQPTIDTFADSNTLSWDLTRTGKPESTGLGNEPSLVTSTDGTFIDSKSLPTGTNTDTFTDSNALSSDFTGTHAFVPTHVNTNTPPPSASPTVDRSIADIGPLSGNAFSNPVTQPTIHAWQPIRDRGSIATIVRAVSNLDTNTIPTDSTSDGFPGSITLPTPSVNDAFAGSTIFTHWATTHSPGERSNTGTETSNNWHVPSTAVDTLSPVNFNIVSRESTGALREPSTMSMDNIIPPGPEAMPTIAEGMLVTASPINDSVVLRFTTADTFATTTPPTAWGGNWDSFVSSVFSRRRDNSQVTEPVTSNILDSERHVTDTGPMWGNADSHLAAANSAETSTLSMFPESRIFTSTQAPKLPVSTTSGVLMERGTGRISQPERISESVGHLSPTPPSSIPDSGDIPGQDVNLATETTMRPTTNIPEISFEMAPVLAILGQPLRLSWNVTGTNTWKYIILQRDVGGTTELIGAVFADSLRVTGGASPLFISADSTFTAAMATMHVDVPSMQCHDEGTYRVSVLDGTGPIAEKRDRVAVLGIPTAKVVAPDDIFEGGSMAGVQCISDLGYPPGKVYLRVQHRNEGGFITTEADPNLLVVTLSEPCQTVVTTSFAGVLDPTSDLNLTSVQCGVADTPAVSGQFGIDLSNTDTIRIIPASICDGSPGQLVSHPYTACKYIDCDAMSVQTCPADGCFDSITSTCVSQTL